jgi:hypothetical protein
MARGRRVHAFAGPQPGREPSDFRERDSVVGGGRLLLEWRERDAAQWAGVFKRRRGDVPVSGRGLSPVARRAGASPARCASQETLGGNPRGRVGAFRIELEDAHREGLIRGAFRDRRARGAARYGLVATVGRLVALGNFIISWAYYKLVATGSRLVALGRERQDRPPLDNRAQGWTAFGRSALRSAPARAFGLAGAQPV